jgi:3-methyladenine DNA glycosylase AlkD
MRKRDKLKSLFWFLDKILVYRMTQSLNSAEEIINEIKINGRHESLVSMANYGIITDKAFGVSIPFLRKLAKQIGKNHMLSQNLWSSGFHEVRILASMVDEPNKVSKAQMNAWANDFNSWDLCDQCCNNLFVYSDFAYTQAVKWHINKMEYVKRAGFVLMASMAVHKKDLLNVNFVELLQLIKDQAADERNFVKKAVNWALRQIGKRNSELNRIAINIAQELLQFDSKAAKWIGRNALNELTSVKIQSRLK